MQFEPRAKAHTRRLLVEHNFGSPKSVSSAVLRSAGVNLAADIYGKEFSLFEELIFVIVVVDVLEVDKHIERVDDGCGKRHRRNIECR